MSYPRRGSSTARMRERPAPERSPRAGPRTIRPEYIETKDRLVSGTHGALAGPDGMNHAGRSSTPGRIARDWPVLPCATSVNRHRRRTWGWRTAHKAVWQRARCPLSRAVLTSRRNARLDAGSEPELVRHSALGLRVGPTTRLPKGRGHQRLSSRRLDGGVPRLSVRAQGIFRWAQEAVAGARVGRFS